MEDILAILLGIPVICGIPIVGSTFLKVIRFLHIQNIKKKSPIIMSTYPGIFNLNFNFIWGGLPILILMELDIISFAERDGGYFVAIITSPALLYLLFHLRNHYLVILTQNQIIAYRFYGLWRRKSYKIENLKWKAKYDREGRHYVYHYIAIYIKESRQIARVYRTESKQNKAFCNHIRKTLPHCPVK